jgi:GrpB-like predicted nucleotidyltransferase (UPF0157 family)
MTAKPIIELVAVVKPEKLRDAIDRLATFGYRHGGDRGIPGREALEPIDGRPPASFPPHHLCVCPEGNRSLEEQPAFRRYLRADPDPARRLSKLKVALRVEHENDRQAYIDGKCDLVREIARLALAALTPTSEAGRPPLGLVEG